MKLTRRNIGQDLETPCLTFDISQTDGLKLCHNVPVRVLTIEQQSEVVEPTFIDADVF